MGGDGGGGAERKGMGRGWEEGRVGERRETNS